MFYKMKIFTNLIQLKSFFMFKNLYLLLLCVIISSPLRSEPAVVIDQIACLTVIEQQFFNEQLVAQSLSLYGVRQELWSPILKKLKGNTVQLNARLKKVTAFMVPNPLEFPMQKDKTAKILKSVLHDIFLETLGFYAITNVEIVDPAFDYIFTQQKGLFFSCFGNVKGL